MQSCSFLPSTSSAVNHLCTVEVLGRGHGQITSHTNEAGCWYMPASKCSEKARRDAYSLGGFFLFQLEFFRKIILKWILLYQEYRSVAEILFLTLFKKKNNYLLLSTYYVPSGLCNCTLIRDSFLLTCGWDPKDVDNTYTAVPLILDDKISQNLKA